MSDSVTKLEKWAEDLYDICERSSQARSTEAAVIADIDPVIRNALVDLYDFTFESMDAEYETLIAREGRSPVDRIYGSVLVEFEYRMGASRKRHGADQALTYLTNLERSTDSTGQFTAVVSDGREWGFLVDRIDDAPSLFTVTERHPEEYFEWRPNSIASCRRFLQICGAHNKQPLSGRSLALAFGPTTPPVVRFVGLLAATLEGRTSDDRTDTLLREWDRSTEVAYGSLESVGPELTLVLRNSFAVPAAYCDEFAELLFVVHTYFAIVARLVAVEVLAISWGDIENQPSHWPSLNDADLAHRIRSLDEGSIPTGAATVQNLFESDVFSWWVDHLDTETLDALRGLLDVLGRFAFPRVAFGATPSTDVLRELYMRLVPRELRKKLGEYPTPFWLAEACLAQMADAGAPLENGRVLDPCCGTGAFLLPILRARVTKLRIEKGSAISQADVQDLLNGVAGMDINPIAVTATRANMLVALGSLSELGGFRLPVWRTDSIVIPDTTPGQRAMDEPRLAGGDFLELRTSVDRPFPVPTCLANAAAIADLRGALEAAMDSDRASSATMFLSRMEDTFGPSGTRPAVSDAAEWAVVRDVLEVLFERVRDLADDKRNGVWARIIENSFAPLFIGRFDAVVGNPPWLGWPYMPERWRGEVEPLWRKYGLWDVPRSPGESGRIRAQFNDIATLVFATSIERYAKPAGWVGFLTPDALVAADPGARAFRKFRLRSDTSPPPVDIEFCIVAYDNWSQIKPFGTQAANKPVFLIAQRDKPQTFPVPSTKWIRRQAGDQLGDKWSAVEGHLRRIEGLSTPADPSASFSAWSFSVEGQELIAGGANSWAFGMGINTRGAAGVFHVDVDRPDIPQGTIRIINRPSDGRDSAVTTHQSLVESALIAPLLRGRDIKPWTAKPSGFIVTTADPSLLTLLPEPEFQRRYPRALAWLRRFRPVLENRSVPNSSWDIHGRDWYRLEGPWAHVAGPYLVVVPEQALPPPAAIVEARTMDSRLGRRAMPIPNHKVVFCAVPTLREAAYLTAVINSPPVQSFLESYGSSTAIAPTTLSRLAIPPFDDTGLTATIADLGVQIHQAADVEAKAAELSPAIAEAVSSLLNASATASQASARSAKRPPRQKKQPSEAASLF